MKFWKFIKIEKNNGNSRERSDEHQSSQNDIEQQSSEQQSNTEEESNQQNSEQESNSQEQTQQQNSEQESNSQEQMQQQNSVQQSNTEEESNQQSDEQQSNSQEESNQQSDEQQSNSQEESNQQNSEQDLSIQEESYQQSSEQQSNTEEESNQQSSEQQSKSQEDSNQQSSEQQSNTEEESNQQSSEQQSNTEEESNQQSSEQQSNSQEESNQQSSEQQSNSQEDSNQQSSEQQSNSQEESNQQSSEQQSNSQEDSNQQSNEQQSNTQEDSNKQHSEEKTNENFEYEQENNDELIKDKVKTLRDILKQIAENQQKEELEKQNLERSKSTRKKEEVEESHEEKYELSDQSNEFLKQLQELPSFEERDRGPGYSIDTNVEIEISDSVIRTLITKFLNQRFSKKNTDLNIRSNSLEETNGFHKWKIKDVVIHLKSEQIPKVLTDKYGYAYGNGKNENVPLSFYFDLSGSMSEYTSLLATIAIELVKKKVKILIGFNERVNIQIDSIEKNIDIEKLTNIIQEAGYMSLYNTRELTKDPNVSFKYVDQNIDNYLISKKAEKCVVFSDFDPLSEVINLSQAVDTYWFCFESSLTKKDISKYNGFIYKVRNEKDIAKGLIKVNENKFEALCYTENPKSLTKRRRKK